MIRIFIAFKSHCCCCCYCVWLSVLYLLQQSYFFFVSFYRKKKNTHQANCHQNIEQSSEWLSFSLMIQLVFQSHGTINSLHYYEHCFFFWLSISSTEANFFPISFFFDKFFFISLVWEGKVKQLKIVIAAVTIQGNNNDKKKYTTKLTNYFHSDSGHDIYSLSRSFCIQEREKHVFVREKKVQNASHDKKHIMPNEFFL